ncbi:MAG: hypothetical protein CfClM3_0258 [Methanobrevibacter sp. CfCl-M3]
MKLSLLIDGTKEIRFHSVNRHNYYDAILCYVDDYNKDKECNHSLEGVNIEVNFYKKSCYYNRFVWNIGYWHETARGDWILLHDRREFRTAHYLLNLHGWAAHT